MKRIGSRRCQHKAVVLLSGGLDSTTVLYYALDKNYAVHCLIFDYGQRHRKEIRIAQQIARRAKVSCDVLRVTMPWRGSALLDRSIQIPGKGRFEQGHVPVTYVPSRNIIFLSFAASCAEAIGARHIFIGANALDYSGYPDCRPEFFDTFQKTIRKGTKVGVEGLAIKIHVPLLHKTKAQIIRLGTRLHVPYELTWSCYKGGARPCGICDSCRLRAKGFSQAGVKDPILRQNA